MLHCGSCLTCAACRCWWWVQQQPAGPAPTSHNRNVPAQYCLCAEVVPTGWDKWRSIEVLLKHWGASASDLVAMGDGSNDLGMVTRAGVGVAMGNAVPLVKAAASLVVADNDSDGVAEAIERLLL